MQYSGYFFLFSNRYENINLINWKQIWKNRSLVEEKMAITCNAISVIKAISSFVHLVLIKISKPHELITISYLCHTMNDQDLFLRYNSKNAFMAMHTLFFFFFYSTMAHSTIAISAVVLRCTMWLQQRKYVLNYFVQLHNNGRITLHILTHCPQLIMRSLWLLEIISWP